MTAILRGPRAHFSLCTQKRPRPDTRERRPRPRYFKRPVDGDDEESLEERRGRTVLRTAMLSTQANRYYGPPDGIQPEFDLLIAAELLSHSRRVIVSASSSRG